MVSSPSRTLPRHLRLPQRGRPGRRRSATLGSTRPPLLPRRQPRRPVTRASRAGRARSTSRLSLDRRTTYTRRCRRGRISRKLSLGRDCRLRRWSTRSRPRRARTRWSLSSITTDAGRTTRSSAHSASTLPLLRHFLARPPAALHAFIPFSLLTPPPMDSLKSCLSDSTTPTLSVPPSAFILPLLPSSGCCLFSFSVWQQPSSRQSPDHTRAPSRPPSIRSASS